jgi:hypothetical protein
VKTLESEIDEDHREHAEEGEPDQARDVLHLIGGASGQYELVAWKSITTNSEPRQHRQRGEHADLERGEGVPEVWTTAPSNVSARHDHAQTASPPRLRPEPADSGRWTFSPCSAGWPRASSRYFSYSVVGHHRAPAVPPARAAG